MKYDVLNSAFAKDKDFQFNISTIETSHIDNPQFGSRYLELVYLINQKITYEEYLQGVF